MPFLVIDRVERGHGGVELVQGDRELLGWNADLFTRLDREVGGKGERIGDRVFYVGARYKLIVSRPLSEQVQQSILASVDRRHRTKQPPQLFRRFGGARGLVGRDHSALFGTLLR